MERGDSVAVTEAVTVFRGRDRDRGRVGFVYVMRIS